MTHSLKLECQTYWQAGNKAAQDNYYYFAASLFSNIFEVMKFPTMKWKYHMTHLLKLECQIYWQAGSSKLGQDNYCYFAASSFLNI